MFQATPDWVLQDIMRRRADLFNSFTLADVSRLDRDISATLADIREWRNSLVPINLVPLDILSLIPTYLSSQKNRIRATFVCRHWRKIFLQNGPLWSQLFLKHGEAYTKTLLERAKGSPLDIVTGNGDPAEAIALLPSHTQKIRNINFVFNWWEDIQQFSEINSGPLPLLRTLVINVVDEFSLDHPNRMTPPSLPLFSNAVNVHYFAIHSERFPFLGRFIFPNLTTFELSATPALTTEPWYHALELFNFLDASPMLRTVFIKIIAKAIRLNGIPRERIVALPEVEVISLIVGDAEAGYQLAAQISCPAVRRTLLVHEKINENNVPQIIFPSPPSWNAISRQYTRNQIDEVSLEIKPDNHPIISCSLSFRSVGTTTLGLEFNLVTNDDHNEEEADLVPYRDIRSATLSQAFRNIRDHPLLPGVKRLGIRYRASISGFDDLKYLANEFGKLLKPVGPLDVLSIYGCDPHFYLTPFLNLREFDNMEHPIVYPSIKELELSHICMSQNKEECIEGIVEFAKSQHGRGIPFERVTFCMERLPAGIAEKLMPWVGVVNCYESLCEEDFL
jgi:hypothetical protein